MEVVVECFFCKLEFGRGGLSFLECQTEWEDKEERHLKVLPQSGRSHSKGSSPVCRRRCALRLYFLEKDLWQWG